MTTLHETDRRPVEGAASQYAFALAGEAIFTVQSKATGTRFTFKVSRADADERNPTKPRPWFVAVLGGPDNTEDYRYLGCLWAGENGSAPRWVHGKKSSITPDAPSAKAWAWTWARLAGSRDLAPEAEMWHEGRCCRCGRRLTVPTSIENGIGPECIKKVGVAA